MNVRSITMFAAILLLWGAATTAVATDETTGVASTGVTPSTESGSATPNVVMPELKYEFDPVVDGTQITHDFVIKNTGDGPLAISKVKTG